MSDTVSKPKHAGGRPPIPYSEDTAVEVCLRMMDGENILVICHDEGMPSWNTLARWRIENPEFARAYAQAREASAEMLEAQVLLVTGTATAENWQIARAHADNLKWAAAKRHPKVYGDRIDATVTFTSGLADRLNAAMQRSGRVVDVEPEAIAAPVDGDKTPDC
jgi:hypothetical protein